MGNDRTIPFGMGVSLAAIHIFACWIDCDDGSCVNGGFILKVEEDR